MVWKNYNDCRFGFDVNRFAVVTGCGFCSSMPERWQFSLSGLTANTCNQQAFYNGTWEIINVGILGQECDYESEERAVDCTSPITQPMRSRFSMLMFGLSPDLVRFSAHIGVGTANYRNSATWNCLGANSMYLWGTTGFNNWPSTITLTPV